MLFFFLPSCRYTVLLLYVCVTSRVFQSDSGEYFLHILSCQSKQLLKLKYMYYVSPYSCHALFHHSMHILYYSFVNHKKSKHSCDISLEVEFSLFSYFRSHTGNIKPHWNWSTAVSLPLLRTLKWKLQGFWGVSKLRKLMGISTDI